MTILDKNHWRILDYRQRITSKQWSEILLANDDTVIYKGNIFKFKADIIGPGVVEIYKDIKDSKN